MFLFYGPGFENNYPIKLPQMCFEGMEESGSEGLDELIEARKDDFFSVSITKPF